MARKVKLWSGGRSLTLEEIRELGRAVEEPVQSGDGEAALAEGVKAREAARARKVAVGLRLDRDVVEWLRRGGKGWQTRVNGVLRERMVAESQSRKAL